MIELIIHNPLRDLSLRGITLILFNEFTSFEVFLWGEKFIYLVCTGFLVVLFGISTVLFFLLSGRREYHCKEKKTYTTEKKRKITEDGKNRLILQQNQGI